MNSIYFEKWINRKMLVAYKLHHLSFKDHYWAIHPNVVKRQNAFWLLLFSLKNIRLALVYNENKCSNALHVIFYLIVVFIFRNHINFTRNSNESKQYHNEEKRGGLITKLWWPPQIKREKLHKQIHQSV